jgi:hypothetical protein
VKLRTYLALLRPRSLWARLIFAVAVSLAVNFFGPFAGQRAGAGTFAVVTLLLPMMVGRELSRALHAVMHRPFGPLLPHLRPTLLRWHLPLLVLLAAGSASLVRWRDTTLGWPVSASLALAGLCLMLPLEGPGRWFGVRWFGGALSGFVIFAALAGGVTRTWIHAWPWLTTLGSLALAVVCCRLGFSRRRLRERAHAPLLDLADAFDPATLRTQSRDKFSRSQRLGRPWRIRSVGESMVNWIRVVLHESFGFRGGWVRQLALIALVAPITVVGGLFTMSLLDATARAVPFGALLYGAIWISLPHSSWAGQTCFLVMLPIFSFDFAVALPRPGKLYPLSRERRAWLTFIVSALQATVQIPLVLASLIALAWVGARFAGVAFEMDAAPNCLAAFLAILPFVPWLLWSRFKGQLRPGQSSLHFIGIPVGIGIASAIATLGRAWLVSAAGAAVVMLITAAGLALYRNALFKFYRDDDLLQPGKAGAITST